MKRTSLALLLFLAAQPAQAQTWSYDPAGHVAIPASVAGASVAGAMMACRGGEFTVTLTGVTIGDGAADAAVALLIDGKLFATTAKGGTGAIAVPADAVPGLKTGKRVTFSFPSGGRTVETTFALKGSQKAIDALAGNCAPANVPEKIAGNGGTIEVADSYQAGQLVSVPFSIPAKSNSFWVGFVNVGGGPTDYLGNGYAYTSSGNPAKITAPSKPGRYEVRLSDDTDKVMLVAKTVTITDPVAGSVSGPANAIGGQLIEVAHSGPDGTSNLIAILPAGARDSRINSQHTNNTSFSPARLRAPLTGGDYELRYLLAVGEAAVLARQPIAISQAPGVALTASEATAGQEFAVELGADAPRLSGDYIYIARPGAAGNNYDGGYFSIPGSGPVKAKAPAEAGAWEIRYVAPDNGDWAALGSAGLTVK
ncbi:MAG: hypothetical protein WAT70_10970 [Rhizobiaceae bacterium]